MSRSPLNIEQVYRAIQVVHAGLAVLSTMTLPEDPYEACKATESAARKILTALNNEHGGTWNAGRGAGDTLTLAGVRTSSTGGPQGLLRNWLTAARRRIEEAEAAR